MAKFSDNSMASIVWDETTLTLSTLGSGSILTANSRIDASRLQGFRILKTQYYFALKSMTPDEGPIMMHLAHDLTAAEMEETIGADPQRSGDPTLEPRALRPVWPLGLLGNDTEGNAGVFLQGEIKLGWSFPEGTILKIGAENISGSALTTGAVVRGRMKHFGVWLRD